MKNFKDYIAFRDLSNSLLENDINVDHFCEEVLKSVEENGIEILEADFIGSAARMASGFGGALGGMAKRFGQSIASGAKAAFGGAGADYKKSAQGQTLSQISDRLKGLMNSLKALGASSGTLSQLEKIVNNYVQSKVKRNAAPGTTKGAPAQSSAGGNNMRVVGGDQAPAAAQSGKVWSSAQGY
jgi:hypothetical protein